MIKAVFFDIDDTLYDSNTLASMARLNSIKAMVDSGLSGFDEGYLYNKLEEIIRRYGPNYSRHYDRLLEEIGAPWEPKVVAAGVVAYEHTKFGFLVPFPGVMPALIELKKKYRLGVISNGLAVKQWEKLNGLGIHHFFDVVVTSEEIGTEKPDKEVFKAALNRLGIKTWEGVMVGDRLDTDIKGAKKAGMYSVHVKKVPKNQKKDIVPDTELLDFSKLPEIIEEFNQL